jgi:cell division septation protein DedD
MWNRLNRFNRRLLFLVVALTLGMSVVPNLSPVDLLADDDGIKVTAVSAESRFPDGIRFSVEARSNDEIDEIRVFFRLLGANIGTAYQAVDFEPGTSVTGEAVLLSGTGGKYIPPGTMIRYSFEVRDTGGGMHRTDDREMMYTDNRFDWETTSSGVITVFYYDGDDEKAEGVLDAAGQAMERMAPVLGLESSDPMRIMTYTNYADMLPAIPFRSKATREQLITEGLAFSEQRVLLVFNPDASAQGTVAHEFTHLLVAQAAGRGHRQLPSWLNEGLAEYGNINDGDSYAGALSRAIDAGRVNPLWYQRTFVGKPGDIIVAYGQARSVVDHMISRHGNDKMAELMKAMHATQDIDRALERVYKLDTHTLDAEWREALGLDPLEPVVEPESQAQPTAPPPPPATPLTVTPPPPPGATPTAIAAPPTDTPEAVPEQDSPLPPPSAGCGASLNHGGVYDLALIALLAGPLAGLWGRGLFRRRG